MLNVSLFTKKNSLKKTMLKLLSRFSWNSQPVQVCALGNFFFIHFYNADFFVVLHSGAEKARDSLNGRFFGGRMVRSDIYDQALYECNDLSG